MSHLDDLDEYEAELELALKREYQAVFALFRYCVLTQDATYLCNRLDVQQAVPSAAGGLPFFQLELEDVWVWDKNRPTRMSSRSTSATRRRSSASTRGRSSASGGGSRRRRSGPGTSWARCSATSSTSARSTGSASPRRSRGSCRSTSTSPRAGLGPSC